MLGAKDEASADAAGMIAKAKAAVKREKAGPGVSVLHQVELMHHSPLDFNEEPLQIPMVTNEPFSLVALRHIRLAHISGAVAAHSPGRGAQHQRQALLHRASRLRAHLRLQMGPVWHAPAGAF